MSAAPSTPSSVPPSDLLQDVIDYLRRFVRVKDEAAVIVALWVIFTHLANESFFQPRLAILSPQPRCGKTTLLRVLGLLVANPFKAAYVTAAALTRLIDGQHPTVLIDEADTFVAGKGDLQGLLNMGFEKEGLRAICEGKDNRLRTYSVWSPIAIAAIGKLEATVTDRSVVIEMQRKSTADRLDFLRVDRPAEANALKDRIAVTAGSIRAAFAAYDPTIPAFASDRASDKYRPLLAIADLLGGGWPNQARAAALKLESQSGDLSGKPLGIQLLEDIKMIFDRTPTVPFISSAELVAKLLEIEESPWTEFDERGRRLNPTRLAQLLKPFGIRPAQQWVGASNVRVYRQADFASAFAAYLP